MNSGENYIFGRSVLIALLLLCGFPHALACSIVLPAYKGFDEREWVFLGEVIGHTKLEKPICRRGVDDAWQLP
jgi:hypothetical protein